MQLYTAQHFWMDTVNAQRPHLPPRCLLPRLLPSCAPPPLPPPHPPPSEAGGSHRPAHLPSLPSPSPSHNLTRKLANVILAPARTTNEPPRRATLNPLPPRRPQSQSRARASSAMTPQSLALSNRLLLQPRSAGGAAAAPPCRVSPTTTAVSWPPPPEPPLTTT